MEIKTTEQLPVSLPAQSGKAPQLRPFHFKKGQSGNPKGCPKKIESLTALLKKTLGKECPIKSANGKTWKEFIVEALLVAATKGNGPAIKEVWERVDGKVVNELSFDGTPIVIKVVPCLPQLNNGDDIDGGNGKELHAERNRSFLSE